MRIAKAAAACAAVLARAGAFGASLLLFSEATAVDAGVAERERPSLAPPSGEPS